MAVSPIVTLGYGSWGSVNKLPTVGYGIGAPAAPPTDFGDGVRFESKRERLFTSERLRRFVAKRQRLWSCDR